MGNMTYMIQLFSAKDLNRDLFIKNLAEGPSWV